MSIQKLQINCPNCGKEATYAPNEQYYGKRYGRSYMCYFCKPCDTYVGVHNNTLVPLGTMANKELRQVRIKTHALLDEIWKSGRMSRGHVYGKLGTHFGKTIHVGEADLKQCEEIIAFITSSSDKIEER